MSKALPRLAFCVFAKQLHVAWDTGGVIVPLENNRVETVLFDIISPLVQKQKFDTIIIPAGPAPFTQLRILRATQLGLSTGLRCHASMVNMFDVLFSAATIETGACLLETRRGDYFFQTRQNGKISDTGISSGTTESPIISDNPALSTIVISQNLAENMCQHDFEPCADLIYGITLPYSTPILPKA